MYFCTNVLLLTGEFAAVAALGGGAGAGAVALEHRVVRLAKERLLKRQSLANVFKGRFETPSCTETAYRVAHVADDGRVQLFPLGEDACMYISWGISSILVSLIRVNGALCISEDTVWHLCIL